jgi:Ca2+-binding EF-hand superfamily protein
MTMRPIAFAAAVLITCTAATAFADDPQKKEQMVKHFFEKSDTNKDGFISAEENQACAKKMFDEGDTNDDGKISRDEMAAYHERTMKEATNTVDKDNIKDMKPGR